MFLIKFGLLIQITLLKRLLFFKLQRNKFFMQAQLTEKYLNQSKDLFWMVDIDFQLIYANTSYLNFMREATGIEKKLNESAFVEHFGKEDVKKWTAYYNRAIEGEFFEIEEHFYNEKFNEIHYSQITFEPLTGDDTKIFAVSCHSKDVTKIVEKRGHASQLMDASLDVFCIVNEQGKFVFVSACAINLWGYLPEELVGTSYIDLILEEDKTKTSKITEAIFRGDEIKSFANRYKKKDGRIAFNLWSARWDNTTKLLYCVAKDGKDLIKQEEKAYLSEQRFKALVQEGADMIAILDAKGNYIYGSPTCISILGIPKEEFIGKSAFEFIHPVDADQALKGLQKLTTKNRVVLAPYRFKNHINEWRWLETVMTNMLDNPVVNGIVANSRDITDRVEEKQQLKLLESVITHTKDAVLITEAEPFDEPGPRIIYVNEAFTKMTGYEAEEVIGKTPRILQGPNSNKEELAKLRQALKNWKPYEMTTINYKKSGEEFWINFAITPVANEKGYYTHWIAIERDVTGQKVKEQERDLVNEINEIFNQSDDKDLSSCLKDLCEHITKFGEFEFAELWLPAIDGKTINRAANYFIGNVGSLFYNTAKDLDSFELGKAIPGHVWKNQTTEIWEDTDKEWKFFKRKAAAKKAGIKSMLGMPLKHNNEIVGVLLIGTGKAKSTLAPYSGLFKKLESIIGTELSRKKIEIELAQIFEFTPDMICLSGFDGYFKRMNPAGLELLGYSLEEIRSKPILSFMHEQDRLTTSKKQQNLYNGEALRNFENRYITKKGDMVWLSWTAISVPEYATVYSVAKNITEEKKLRELNRQAGRLGKIGSWEFDILNQHTFWTNEVHKLHETDPESFVPSLESSINFYRKDFQPLVKLNVEKCISTGEPFDIEAVIITSKKKDLWVRVIGNAEVVDGKCLRIYGSTQDIDDLKAAEIRLKSLADNIPGVVFQYLIYPDGTDALNFVTQGSKKTWGFSSQEVLQNNQLVWDNIKAGGEFEKVQKSITDSVEFKTKWTCRFKYVMPSGELRTHLGSGTPAFLADGTILFDSIILDVTQEAKNEELLAQTAKIARIGSWEMDLTNQDDNHMYWSPMLFDILELDDNYKPTLTGAIEFHIGESKEQIQKVLEVLISDGVEFDEEILLVTAKGNERWSRAIGKSEVVNNKRTKIYGSFQDINERKKAELAIRDSEEKRKLILNGALDAIISIDTNERITFWNQQAEVIFGWKEAEVIGKLLSEMIIPLPLRKYHVQGLKHYLKTGEGKALNVLLELSAIRQNGEEFPIELTILPIKQGGEEFFCAFIRDTTERKKAEKKILDANERFEKVIDATNDSIWDWDLVKNTNKRHKVVERFFGKESSKSSPITSFWQDNFHPEDLDKVQYSVHKAINDPTCNRWELQYRVINEKGEILYVKDRGLIMRNKEGIALRMIGAMSDISDQKRMTVQLSELNKDLQQQTLELKRSNDELEQFAFVASHDLQEPLRMISSFMDLLKRKYGDQLDDKGNQYIYFATDGAKRMKQIILDLLDYSRASKLTEGTETIDVNQVLSEFKQLRRKLISEKNAAFKSNTLPILITYRAAITQIFHCLLDNALKYSEDSINPIIEVDATENEKGWEFAIKDNGIGIEPQFHDKIFVIFQRLHNNETYAGTGIGLAVAKKHVEILKGKLWLESEPGKGSIFYFTIPKSTDYE
jgi:PAS domain S-box-containing protein